MLKLGFPMSAQACICRVIRFPARLANAGMALVLERV